jgi:hypothetical protein
MRTAHAHRMLPLADSKKYRKVLATLEKEGHIKPCQTVTPCEATREVLADVHTQVRAQRSTRVQFMIVASSVTSRRNGNGLTLVPAAALCLCPDRTTCIGSTATRSKLCG